jgi:hypothetical protein
MENATPRSLESVLGKYELKNAILQGNSANCLFTFVTVGAGLKTTYFVKVQLNPNTDDINIDNIIGNVLNIALHGAPPMYRIQIPKYIGCCSVDVFLVDMINQVYSLGSKTGEFTPTFPCVASVQEALEKPLSLFDLFDTILQTDKRGNHFPETKDLVDYTLDLLSKIFRCLAFLGRMVGFVHNDAHLGNIQYSSKNGIDRIHLIDMGRIGLNIPEHDVAKYDIDKIITNVINNTISYTDEDFLFAYKDELKNTIFHSNMFVAPSQYSYIFDIATIVLNVLQEFDQHYYLKPFVESINETLKKNPTTLPELRLEFKKVNLIDYLVINTPDILKQLAESITDNHPEFYRYLFTGLSVLASIACEYKTFVSTDLVIAINLTQMIHHKIIFRCFQFCRPVSLSLVKKVYMQSCTALVRRKPPVASNNIRGVFPKIDQNKPKTDVPATTPASSERPKSGVARIPLPMSTQKLQLPEVPGRNGKQQGKQQGEQPRRGGTPTMTTPPTTLEEHIVMSLKSKKVNSSEDKSSKAALEMQCSIEAIQYETFTNIWNEAIKPELKQNSPPKPPQGYSWEIEKRVLDEAVKDTKSLKFPKSDKPIDQLTVDLVYQQVPTLHTNKISQFRKLLKTP